MLSIERTKQLLGKPGMSDEEAEKIRDSVRSFVEIIFEKWKGEKDAKSK
jgi:hypothetical protein